MTHITCESFREMAKQAVHDHRLHEALFFLQERLGKGAAAAYRNLPEGPNLRLKAHQIRKFSIDHLDILLESLAEKIEKNGGNVFFAKDAVAARSYCLEVAKKHGVRLVVKGKSMTTEEIGLNNALIGAGIEAVETDLGEFIIQLAGERPSHIIAPAIHKTRDQIGMLFSQKLSIPYSDDPPTLTMAARNALRKKFLQADMGISGCNIACAETGHITTVSNEGNIRMVSTIPDVYMVFMGMERVTARLADHEILFRLLSRGAAAQQMAGYVSYIGGPEHPSSIDGPKEFHLVILDNGRSRILADSEFREILYCIRCAGCLNVCPVYAKIGGHTYGYAYSGPIGSVITPLLVGVNRAKDLCMGETLCGACRNACPVDINIPKMLLKLRSKLAEGDPVWNVTPISSRKKFLFSVWSWIIQDRNRYDRFIKMCAKIQSTLGRSNRFIQKFFYSSNGWTKYRELPVIPTETFIRQWQQRQGRT